MVSESNLLGVSNFALELQPEQALNLCDYLVTTSKTVTSIDI